MILYAILFIVFGIVILLALAALVYGVIKKRKNLLLTAGVLFTVGMIGCVFSAMAYTKNAIEYISGKEFQNDAKKGSEFVGKTVGSVSSGVSSGLASTLDDEAIANLAKKSGTVIGKSIKTIASSLDSTLGTKNVFIDKTLENSGITLGRAQETYTSKARVFEIFIDYTKNFEGKLQLTNYDQNGKKIEVVKNELHAKAGQGNVEEFHFLHSDLGLTTYYILSKAD